MSNIGWVQTIFLSLAKRFGLELQAKPEYEDDFQKPESITAVMGLKISTLTLQDSSFSVKGTNARAKYLDDFIQRFVGMGDSLKGCCVSTDTGDCLIKPYTDGKRIGLNLIENKNFVICESIGDYIKSIIIKTGEIRTDNGVVYERYEVQRIVENENGSMLEIFNFAYRNMKEIPLTDVSSWANIKPYQSIPNVEYLLFGRYKCPTLNRGNVNSPNGVKITYGLDKIVDDAMQMYHRYVDEFERKESFLFVDKTLFKKTKQEEQNVRYEIPKGKEKVFLKVRGQEDGKNLIQDYSPNIRSNEMENGINVIFRTLELMAGLSNGILTAPTTSFTTATEMKAALQATFAFMTQFRNIIDEGNRQLLRAVDVIANYNELTPMGDWEYTSDWSYGYIEQITEAFNQRLALQGVGGLGVDELRAFTLNEDLETARKRVEEIAEQEGKDLLKEAVKETEPPPDGGIA